MSSKKEITRRDRIVMALGLVALLLFTANLLTFVKHRIIGVHAHDAPAVEWTEETIHHHTGQEVFVVERPADRHGRYQFRVRYDGGHEFEALHARLAGEAAQLASEAERLESFGHVDAAIALQEAAEEVRERMQELEFELQSVQETLEDVEITVGEVSVAPVVHDATVVVEVVNGSR